MKEAIYRDAAGTCRMAAEEYRKLGLEDHAKGAELCAHLIIMALWRRNGMTYESTTTLREIRAAGPCGIREGDDCGWAKLLRNLGEPHGKPNLDRTVTVLEILNSNGFDDALWCLQVPSLDRLSRHFQAWCVEQVLPIFEAARPGDMRVRERIAERRNDAATPEERERARDAAQAAAWAAWDAARDAAAWAAVAWAASAATAAAVSDAAQAAARDAAQAAQEKQLRLMIGETE